MTAALGPPVSASPVLPRFLQRDARGPRPDRPQAKRRPTTLPLSIIIATVLLPFAAGYYLSYVFRTINAVMAGNLAAEFRLGPAELGFMTSVYFLAFVAVQLPAGVALDRYGPRRVQSTLLLVAAVGSLLFATADSVAGLMLGRALIGFGVAISLMAGLKAIVLWVPPERLALANGLMVMLGALGAVTATTPAETLIAHLGWRGLFWLLAWLCAVCALLIYAVVPEARTRRQHAVAPALGLRAIYTDPRFWRIAPLSATTIATSWSIQGLWAAPWLANVEALARGPVVAHLFAMAVALSVGALLLGVVADRLRRRGVSPHALLAAMAASAILAQLAIITRMPIPAYGAWIVVSVAGAATVLSFASMAELFAKETLGRANAALNLLHVGGALIVQCLTGFVVALWPEQNGHHPAIAYQTAFAANLALQVSALTWFLLPSPAPRTPLFLAHAIHCRPATQTRCVAATAGYERAIDMWVVRVRAARHQVAAWRAAAVASAVLMLALSGSFVQALATQKMATAHVVHPRHPDREAGSSCAVSADIAPASSRSRSVHPQAESAMLAAKGSGSCFR
jgi:MFS family permease